MSNIRDPSLPEPGTASTGPALSTGDAAASPFVNLQVVSPSSQVRSPLSFQLLPASTTVKELKERIRNALEVSPTAESQRLIYRGRMLARDTETMMEIFGEETVCLLHFPRYKSFGTDIFYSSKPWSNRPSILSYDRQSLIMFQMQILPRFHPRTLR